MRDGIGCLLMVLMTFVGFMSGKRYEREAEQRREAKLLSEAIPPPPDPSLNEYYFGQSLPSKELKVGDSFKMSDGSIGKVITVYRDGILVQASPPEIASP